MMYQRKRSFAGGSSWGCSPSGGGVPASAGKGTAFGVSCCVSSGIAIRSLWCEPCAGGLLQRAEPVVEVLEQRSERRVDDPEEASKEEDGDEHHHGGGLHLAPGGRDHLAHLGAHVGEEVPAARHDAECAVRDALVGVHRCCFGHRLLLFRAFLCNGHDRLTPAVTCRASG